MKKIVLIVAAAVTVLAVAVGVTLLIRGHSVSEWQEKYDLGIRYLNEGKYDEAVIAFTAAIDIDPKPQAYANRAQAYAGAGQFDKAVEDYERASDLLSWIFYVPEMADAYVAMGDYDSAVDLYQRLYDMTGDEMWLERIEDIRQPSQISGVVYAWGENMFEPIEGARVAVLNADNGVVARSLTTDGEGVFRGQVLAGRYRVVVIADGYRQTEAEVNADRGTVGYVETIYLLSEEDIGPRNRRNTGDITGQIRDAVNGEILDGTRVGITDGWNASPDDEEIFWTETDEEGRFLFPDLPVGYYTLFAQREDYLLDSENVVASSKYQADWTMTISPELGENEALRIVLTWGSIPDDLDSHLVVDGDSSFFYTDKDVYFGSMSAYNANGDMLAMLDVDDTTQYGPETVTIYELEGHSFTYMVYDFSSGGSSSRSRLAQSGATVTVYGEGGVIAEYHVPATATGVRWDVFSVDEFGRIRTIGTVQ